MQKIYTYNPTKYKVHIIFLGYFMIAAALVLGAKWLMAPGVNIYLLGLIAAVYGSLNTFVFKANPRDIIIDDEYINFVSFGEHKYAIDEFTQFNIREFANAQFFIRLETKGGKKARYWVQYYHFSDREALIDELYHIEMKVHPTNIKFRGRERQFAYRPGAAPEGWLVKDDDED